MGVVVLDRKKRLWAYSRWCEGFTQAEIADALGVCPKTISRILAGKVKIKPILEYKEK